MIVVDDPCGDCGVIVGFAHREGCDVARCLWTGRQRISCDEFMDGNFNRVKGRHDCGNEVWTGEWPGDADARRFGWFSYWGPDYGEQGWVRCGPDHPGAGPDLNRLHNPTEARWDRVTLRWEKLGCV